MLNQRQKKCIELMASGKYTQVEIAQKIHVNACTISEWKKNSEFISEYDASLRTEIKEAAGKAFQTEIALLNARSEMVRVTAAKDILDRAGFKPEDNINLTGSGTVVIIDDCDQ